MLNSIFNTLLQLAILVPFTVAAGRDNRPLNARLLLAAALVFVVTSVATDLLSNVSLFPGQQWNWAGKATSLLLASAFVFAFRPFPPRRFGLMAKPEWKGAQPVLLVCAAYFFLRLALYFVATKHPGPFHTETILFQATLPGLEEEVVFRGILLTLLNRVFARPRWTFANVSFGWAAVLVSLLFGLTHGVFFDGGFHLQTDAFSFLRTTVDGFLFALLAEKTKSLVPGVLCHNLLNLIGNH